MLTDNDPSQLPSTYARLIVLIGSPLKFFGLVALICASVFGICAVWLQDRELFIFCMHMFMAIVFAIAVIAVWCPASLYHPVELKEVPPERLLHKPWPPTIVGLVGLVLYMIFQLIVTVLRLSHLH
jgi:hypothetical protein